MSTQKTTTTAADGQNISKAEVEDMELIALDTRKMFVRVKGGCWSWCDKGDQHTLYGTFDTRLEALRDAVEPYLTEEGR